MVWPLSSDKWKAPEDKNIIFLSHYSQETQHEEDFHLKPTSKTEVLDTSKWPLLLKVNHHHIIGVQYCYFICIIYFHELSFEFYC